MFKKKRVGWVFFSLSPSQQVNFLVVIVSIVDFFPELHLCMNITKFTRWHNHIEQYISVFRWRWNWKQVDSSPPQFFSFIEVLFSKSNQVVWINLAWPINETYEFSFLLKTKCQYVGTFCLAYSKPLISLALCSRKKVYKLLKKQQQQVTKASLKTTLQ